MKLNFSQHLAIAIGIALPLAETWRLSRGGAINWAMDHYLMSAILLIGVWKSRRNFPQKSLFLVMAWAFTCGVGYMNLFSRLEGICSQNNTLYPDGTILAVTGLGWLICILGLMTSINASKASERDSEPLRSQNPFS